MECSNAVFYDDVSSYCRTRCLCGRYGGVASGAAADCKRLSGKVSQTPSCFPSQSLSVCSVTRLPPALILLRFINKKLFHFAAVGVLLRKSETQCKDSTNKNNNK